MKPTKELLELAKVKAANLDINQMIRLTTESLSYWVYNFDGKTYIGVSFYEPKILPNFFKNKPTYTMRDKRGEVMAILQKL